MGLLARRIFWWFTWEFCPVSLFRLFNKVNPTLYTHYIYTKSQWKNDNAASDVKPKSLHSALSCRAGRGLLCCLKEEEEEEEER